MSQSRFLPKSGQVFAFFDKDGYLRWAEPFESRKEAEEFVKAWGLPYSIRRVDVVPRPE